MDRNLEIDDVESSDEFETPPLRRTLPRALPDLPPSRPFTRSQARWSYANTPRGDVRLKCDKQFNRTFNAA